MSYALNRNGIILTATKGSIKSDNPKDKYDYWFRVKELSDFLIKRFGKGDFERVMIENNYIARKTEANFYILDKIKGKKGIIVFEVTGWRNATGHFTLWDGGKLLYAPSHDNPNIEDYYFWFSKTSKVIFWELK